MALVAGCLDGEFPSLGHRYPIVDLEALVEPAGPRERLRRRLAEERALFRLAVTRAQRATVLFASTSSGSRNPRSPSRFADRLGVQWMQAEEAGGPATSLRMMEAWLRRRLADPKEASPGRLAALAMLPRVGARPGTWWWHRDWTDPGAPLREGELRTSYSRLSTLQNCGLQYLYEVEMGLDPDASHQMWMGSLVHDVIDRIQRGDLKRDREAAYAAIDEAWDPDKFPNRAIEHRRHRDASNMLDRWIDNEQAEPERSEVAFEFPIGEARMRGRIDAIFRMETGGLRVVDYKTARYPMTKDDAREDLQLAAYYLAIKRDPELSALGEPRYLQLAYLGAERKRDGFARVDVAPNKIEGYEEWAERTIRELLARVRAEDFAPGPEADCRWCSFKTICPLWPEGEEVAG